MFDMIETFARTAAGSDVFAAGLALGALGLGVGVLTHSLRAASALIGRRVRVSLTLDTRSENYRSLMAFLTDQGAFDRARRLQLTGLQIGRQELLGPDNGGHWCWSAGHLCHVFRDMDDTAKVSRGHGSEPLERLTLTVYFGHRGLLCDWLSAGRQHIEAQERVGPALHVLRGDWWDNVGDVPSRALDTVVCEDDSVTRLATDVARFLDRRAWYADRGVPWRRGYLLHGPPGTGKSSVIRALASHFGRDLATLDLGRADLTDDGLREAMLQAPQGAFLVVEDVDAIFRQRDGTRIGGISFSGLLNAIDGVGAQEGRPLFMSTNHRERLDPALIRPGRADVHVALGLISAGTARRLFLRFFPGAEAEANTFAARLGSGRYSPAAVQAWLLLASEDAQTAAQAHDLVNLPQIAAE